MYSLFKKEIKIFLGSLTGYLAILVFLLVSGLFLWLFTGAYNIPDSGYATLDGFFQLAPWLYLFLVPAITMRFFADEKRSGTLELLLTRPVKDVQLVAAKFFAGLVLVVFSLLPTLLYFLSVYLLGVPVGSIDTGATWGSFIGLFFLAAIYVAIGVFASALTGNQIVAFIFAMLLSFLFYLGFDFIGSTGIAYGPEQLFSWLSIHNHYLSISRGVVDLRDLIYFIGMTSLFVFFTGTILRKGEWKQRKTITRAILFFAGWVIVFLASANFLIRVDLTSDKRFSLSGVSKQIVSEMKNPVDVEIFLAGELEPGLRKLQDEIVEKIAVLNVYSSASIRVKIFNPYSIANAQKRKKFIENIVQKGIKPTSFRHKTEKGVTTKLIFPGALIHSKGKEIGVNFLKYNPDFSHELNFNHSVESVEFELINAFRKLMRKKKTTVAFLEGQQELNKYEVLDFSHALSADFQVKRLTVSELAQKSDSVAVLIVANPHQPFTEKEKLIIDQYIMKGGKVVWLIDPVQVSLDSLSNGYQTYSFPRDLNLSDQFFRYGFRLNYELLQDVECAQIKVNTALPGNQPKFTIHPWYYSPLLIPNDNHPVSRNLNRVFAEFVSSIDTVSGNAKVKKEVILSTSPHARRVKAPSSVSLQNINNPPARELFSQSFIPVGVILEGKFTSVFKNRMVENYGLSQASVIPGSKSTQMVVIADGGIIANRVNYSSTPPRIQKLGYDRVSRQTFGNKEFLLNVIDYLADSRGIMQLRNRTLKMRLLDSVRLREEKAYWQWLNIVAPGLVIILFGALFNLFRKRRFSRS